MMTSKRLTKYVVTAGLSVSSLMGLAQAAPAPAFGYPSDFGFRNDSWSFGERFTVGANNITVTSLGAYDSNQDGFLTQGGIKVGLFRESDQALLVSTQVLSTSALSGIFRFEDIADIQLSANTQYRVVAVNEDDLYNVSFALPTVDSRIASWDGYGYCNTTALTFCNGNTGGDISWMANFQIDDGQQSVPEPHGLLLMGVGALALVATRRRKSV